MLCLQVMLTNDEILNGALIQHFNGNMHQKLEAAVTSVCGLETREFYNATDEHVALLKESFFPSNYDNDDVLQVLESVADLLTNEEADPGTVVQQYVIYRVHQMFCNEAERQCEYLWIPFLKHEELIQAYIKQVEAEQYEWSREEISEYAYDLARQVEDFKEWMPLLFDDMDYLLLEHHSVSELIAQCKELGMRF